MLKRLSIGTVGGIFLGPPLRRCDGSSSTEPVTRRRTKRGSERRKVDLDTIEIALNTPADELLDLDEALKKLAIEYPDCIELVKLRFFAGMTHNEAAHALGLARRTADRYWAFARAWLHQQLCQDSSSVEK